MAVADIQHYLKLLPRHRETRDGLVWLTYDADVDTLYVNYKRPARPPTVN